MVKIFILVISVTTLFLLFPLQVFAQVVTVNQNGGITWNVLADETSIGLNTQSSSSIEIKKVGGENVTTNPTVSLSKEAGKVNLMVVSGGETKDVSIPDGDKSLVEVEERPQIQKITIGLKGDKFILTQQNVSALTDYPLRVDASSARLSITTPSGDQFLSVMPYEAVRIILRSRLISRVDGSLEIMEENTKPSYKITGAKIFNFFNLYSYSVPITAYVSTLNGEVVSIDSPSWFKVLKFLFI